MEDLIEIKSIITFVFPEVDLFVFLISSNSLNSPYVKIELLAAMDISKNTNKKEICPIIIDKEFDAKLENRIPEYIKERIRFSATPEMIEQIIKKVIIRRLKISKKISCLTQIRQFKILKKAHW